jgi:hypothetical protein
MAVRICVFLSQRGSADRPPSPDGEVVYETLVMQAMEHFPEFRMNPRGYLHATPSVSSQLVAEMLEADLVIVDLPQLSSSGFYELGVRQASGLPTVFIADLDYVLPFDAHDFPIVQYHWAVSPNTVGDQATIDTLVEAIRDALETSRHKINAPRLPRTKVGSRGEMASRLRSVAAAISDLRINSLQQHVEELEQISVDLETDSISSKGVPEAAEKALKIIARLLDVLGSRKGAEIIIAGSMAGILSLGGWQAASVYLLTLASLKGKDAFLKALEKLGKKRS